MPTKIAWADESWNPVTGCTPIAEGCKNCYAKAMAARFWGTRPFNDVQFHPDRLDKPKHWKKPRRIFVCSMGDLFHSKVKQGWRNHVWLKMMKNVRHTYIVLTKRPVLAREWTIEQYKKSRPVWPEHIHLGISISTQAEADEHIPQLLEIPAAVRIVSFEPAIEHVKFGRWLEQIDGVIMGCESGWGRRPFKMEWAQSMRDQCTAAGVPFFFKQAPNKHGRIVEMPELDGRVWDQLPERSVKK